MPTSFREHFHKYTQHICETNWQSYQLSLSCTLIARFILQLREYQSIDFVATSDGGGRAGIDGNDEHLRTLSTLRPATIIDSILLEDFGDGDVSGTARGSARETESSNTKCEDATLEKEKSTTSRGNNDHDGVNVIELGNDGLVQNNRMVDVN